MTRLPWDEYWLQQARYTASRSTCSRKAVGAVLVTPMNISIATGYNGAPRGLPHCVHDGTEESCGDSVHAEANAIAAAAWVGSQTGHTTCYSTLAPCKNCAGLLINSGIDRLVFIERYRSYDGLQLLKDAGVTVDWLYSGTLMNLN